MLKAVHFADSSALACMHWQDFVQPATDCMVSLDLSMSYSNSDARSAEYCEVTAQNMTQCRVSLVGQGGKMDGFLPLKRVFLCNTGLLYPDCQLLKM